jgi:hypothetical protein
MGKKNVASSGFTAVQVGRVVPPGEEDETKAPKQEPARRGKGATVNVRSGQAVVGVQADMVVGDITVVM